LHSTLKFEKKQSLRNNFITFFVSPVKFSKSEIR